MDRPLDLVDRLLLWGAGGIFLFLVLLGLGWFGLQLRHLDRPPERR